VAARGVDVVLLVRGGGATTDLAAFDGEAIARAIAELPVPVLTGIGHDVDRSVADDVAHRAYKTPTACAQAVVDDVRALDERLTAGWLAVAAGATRRLRGQADRLRSCGRHVAVATRHGLAAADRSLAGTAGRVRRSAFTALARSSATLDRSGGRVEAGARAHLRGHDHALAAADDRLRQRAPRALGLAERELGRIAGQVRALDPARTLARGWSVTRDADGAVVRSPAQVGAGSQLRTTVAGGEITSTVVAAPDPTTRPDTGEDR
jgi:exodeoxyribonuclease VII large subunit